MKIILFKAKSIHIYTQITSQSKITTTCIMVAIFKENFSRKSNKNTKQFKNKQNNQEPKSIIPIPLQLIINYHFKLPYSLNPIRDLMMPRL